MSVYLGRRKKNRSDGFLLWTLLKCKTFPSTNQIAWNGYTDEELVLYMDILHRILWFGKRTAKALIRLHGYTVSSIQAFAVRICSQASLCRRRFILFLVTIVPYYWSIEGWRPLKGYLANSADPDQTPQNAASDQGLHCLQIVQPFFFRNIDII